MNKGKGSFEEFLKSIIGESEKDVKIESTESMRENWLKLHIKYKEAVKLHDKADRKATNAKNRFWAQVEDDLDKHEKRMKVSDDQTKIEILED